MYTSRVAGVATYDAAGSEAPRRSLGKDEFLQLLVTQLRNLDIGEGASNQEFIAQMAQFTMVEELQNLSATVTEMMSRQMIAEAGGWSARPSKPGPEYYTDNRARERRGGNRRASVSESGRHQGEHEPRDEDLVGVWRDDDR